MTAGPGSACFHCGEPIPAGVRIHARIDSREEPVCCHGCKAVAEFITGAGLDDYYKYRDRSGARADEPPRPDRWSAYDRPELVERLTRAEANGARSITVLLEGLRCSACSWLADKALHLQSGVLDVSVNPATARARLVWDPSKVRLGDLLRVLEHVGLRPHPLAGEPAEQIALLERRSALKRLAVAGFGMMQVMMFALPLYVAHTSGMEPGMREFFRLVSMLVSIPVALYSGWPFYQGAWHALKARSVSMDVPVTLGIVIAFVASVWNALTGQGEVYFDSVTMFVFFLSLGRYVEMVARHRAGSVADALARLAPVTARRVRDETSRGRAGDRTAAWRRDAGAHRRSVCGRRRRGRRDRGPRRRIDAHRRIDRDREEPAVRRCTPARRTSARRCACASLPSPAIRSWPASSRCWSGHRPSGPGSPKPPIARPPGS